ncbi:MAG: hypothetical protein EBX41_00005, partial [Chitinophagia bacterium]|nr:hypothetical protein [Chitinophagia bacterium]
MLHRKFKLNTSPAMAEIRKVLLLSVFFLAGTLGAKAQVISTIAGNGSHGFSGDGGAATAAGLSNPFGVAVDASGNVYIADRDDHCIRKVNTSGIISTIAGDGYGSGGSGRYSGDGGAATAASLNEPVCVAVDASGNVYIADTHNNRIRKVNTSGIISTIAGNGSSYGYSGDGGAATAASLYYPYGVAVDASGNVYISYNDNRIRKVNTSGIISTIAGNGSNGYSGDGGAATAASLRSPNGVAVDASGNVYFADYYNYRIRKVNTSGVISTIAGNGSNGYSGDGGAATAASLYNPQGVAVDASGNVYIADAHNHRIRKVNTSGVITTIAGNGSYGYSGDGGAATAASLADPIGVAVDVSGNLYIADITNVCIRKVTFSSTGGGSTTTRRTYFLRADPHRFAMCSNMQKVLKDILATTARDAGLSLSYTL